MLPGVKIIFTNGNLGGVVPTADNVFGLISSGVQTAQLDVNEPVLIRSLADAEALGILPDTNNFKLHSALKRFFAEAGEGTKLWLVIADESDDGPPAWFEANDNCLASELVNASRGEISIVWTKYFHSSDQYTVQNGLWDQQWTGMQKADAWAKWYTNAKHSPVFVVQEAIAFNGSVSSLIAPNSHDFDRAAIVIGSAAKRSGTPADYGSAVELVMGRLAKLKVHENPGKVKAGSLNVDALYIVDTPVEQFAGIADLHDKGFITFRMHPGRSGYYITDDPMAAPASDDYSSLARRRTIDKAYRIAHNVLTDEVLNDFDLMPDGSISPHYAKYVEGRVEQAIYRLMTLKGELSRDMSDDKDLGVRAQFDLTRNVAATGELVMSLSVRPKGYARYIEVQLGFQVETT